MKANLQVANRSTNTTTASSLAIWIVALELAIVFAGSTIPTPLYQRYKLTYSFSEITLTLIYAVYVLGNLLALFLFGRLSDQIGRRRITLPALGVAALSTLVFGFALSTSWLFLARALSGLATGLASGAATAWISELHPRNDKTESATIAVAANLAGLAIGPLAAGFLSQYCPSPLRLSYFIYLPVLVCVALAISRTSETLKNPVSHWGEVSLRPRLGVPKEIHGQFLSPAVTAFGILSLMGFFAALVPGLLAQSLHQKSSAVSGAIVFGLFMVGAVTAAITRKVKSQKSMLAGLVILLPSLAFLLMAEALHSMGWLIAATVVGGIASALAYGGSLQVTNEIAPSDQRSEVISTYMIACYLGNSVPVVGIGLLSGITSSMTAHIIFAAVVAAFAMIGLITGIKYGGKQQTSVSNRKAA